MPTRFMNLDFQMLGLNAASVGSLVANSIAESYSGWSVGFLIFTVGVLNLAKAYATIRDRKKK